MLATVAIAMAAPGRLAPARPVAAQLAKGGDGTFIVSVGAEASSLNPNLDASPITQLLAPNLFSRLLTLDSEFRFTPDLARSWEVSDGGLTYTFVLEQPLSGTISRGASWHDGEPVTSRDVQFTFEQILATPAALAQPALAAVSSVETSEVSGLNATPLVVFRLSEPDPAFLTTLATNGTYILPAHIYQGSDWTTNPANQAPVGSGPFQFLSATPGTTVDLGAYHAYFDTGPYLDQVIFQLYPDPAAARDALVHGEIDLIVGPLPAAEQLPVLTQVPGIVIDEQPAPVQYFLGFNLAREALANADVRHALAGVLDRQAIVTAALEGFGQPATRFTPGLGGPPAEEAALPALSLEEAAMRLTAASSPAATNTRLALELPYPADDAVIGAIAMEVQAQLAGIDVALTLAPVPAADWRERLASSTFDLAIVSQPVGGTAGALASLVGSGGIGNYWGYADSELDAALAAAPIERAAAAPAPDPVIIERILTAALPVVPLVLPRRTFPHTDRALGLPFGPRSGEVALNRYSLVRWREERDDIGRHTEAVAFAGGAPEPAAG